MAETGTVNTAVAERRRLRFGSPDELLAEVDGLVAADRAGRLRATGNWTLGQALGHLATWIDFGYDGFPASARPSWFVKAFLRLVRGKILRDGMRAGVRIPGMPAGTLGVEELETGEGVRRFRRAWERLRAGPPRFASPGFGAMAHAEVMAMHTRHAELHLGFFREMEGS